MSDTNRKPLPPGLMAINPILEELPLEEEPEGGGEAVNLRDFTVGVNIFYPQGEIQRDSYRTEEGQKIPEHHWRVYDLVRQIPVGKVTTYKKFCAILGEGSPPCSVGTALANNPFAPFVPCHRVIANNRTIGGFCGEEPKPGPKDDSTVSLCDLKLRMLRLEGVKFGHGGRLVTGAVWLVPAWSCGNPDAPRRLSLTSTRNVRLIS